MMQPKNNERMDYIMRVISQRDENRIEPSSYRFEILYIDKLVLTDGVSYTKFDECVESLYSYMLKLYKQKPFEPFVVTFD